MQNKSILLDMDGVVADFASSVLKLYNADYKDSLVLEDCTSYAMHKVVGEACGHDVYKYYHAEGTFYNCELVAGAKEAVDKLVASGFNIVFVTKPVDYSFFCMREKQLWVDKHFPAISSTNMVFTCQKHLVYGDVLIDDHINNLTRFNGKRILMDAPWNRAVDEESYNTIRCADWSSVLKELCNE